MRELTATELAEVNGGEILVSPGQLGIAFTNNSLIVITGTAEAAAALGAIGAITTAYYAGYTIGSWLDDRFHLSEYYSQLCWNYTH